MKEPSAKRLLAAARKVIDHAHGSTPVIIKDYEKMIIILDYGDEIVVAKVSTVENWHGMSPKVRKELEEFMVPVLERYFVDIEDSGDIEIVLADVQFILESDERAFVRVEYQR